MKIYLAVGLAGAIGTIMRYFVGVFFFTNSLFPFATLIVNLIGCYFLALFMTVLFKKMNISELFKNAVSSGLIGSFTTFSALSVETVDLMKTGNIILAIIYIGVSMIGGLFFSRFGFHVGKGRQ